MMRNKNLFFLLIVFLALSCSKNVTIELPSSEEKLVVEGHIETGQPPYVLLSRSSDFYSTFSLSNIDDYFVHGAVVKVFNGTDTVTLNEYSLDTLGTTISVYAALNMVGEIGKTYQLWIEAEGKKISSSTTIPQSFPLDSMWWEDDNDPGNDSLVRLICRYIDPPQLGQYIRYFTKVDSQEYFPGLNSVFEDDVINGTTFDFPLDRGVNRNDSTSYDNYGLFKKGDTISVKWCSIDKAQFDFWRTLEFELGSEGSPFATPTYIQSNIEGGLGIWGGYGSTFRTIIVPQ